MSLCAMKQKYILGISTFFSQVSLTHTPLQELFLPSDNIIRFLAGGCEKVKFVIRIFLNSNF